MSTEAPALAHLHRRLDAGLVYAPEFDHGLSTHLPMCLHALHAIGASGARLDAFAAAYEPRLERLPSARPAAEAWPQWAQAIGERSAYLRLEAHFRDRIARVGAPAAVREAAPRLMRGVAGSALHGLIRCAHALEAAHDDECAAALATWASTAVVLIDEVTLARVPSDRDVPSWVGAVMALTTVDALRQPRIVPRMKVWAAEPGFAVAAASLAVDDVERTWCALAEACLTLYARTGNFTVLHMVTATRAFGVLLPLLDDDARAPALRHLGVAAAAALRASRVTMADFERPMPEPLPWPELIAQAVASNDDHLPKIVHACHVLRARCDPLLCARAATRAVLTPH